jgi:hypothetical protein
MAPFLYSALVVPETAVQVWGVLPEATYPSSQAIWHVDPWGAFEGQLFGTILALSGGAGCWQLEATHPSFAEPDEALPFDPLGQVLQAPRPLSSEYLLPVHAAQLLPLPA